jgi:hypothetical protein
MFKVRHVADICFADRHLFLQDVSLPRPSVHGDPLAREIEHSLERLKGVCERIAGGRYEELDDLFDMTAAPDLPEVVSSLAEAFAGMAVQIEAREFRLTETLADLNEAHRQLGEAHKKVASENAGLRHEVQKLRIEIDHGRRDKEVSEIAETDYFQMLRSRAQEMRGRYKRGDSGGPDQTAEQSSSADHGTDPAAT